MIYQVGKKQCSISGRKQNDIAPLESDFMVQPPSLLEFPGPLTPPPPWNFQFPPWWRSGYFLEPHNVSFCEEGKTGVPGEKPLRAKERTKNKLNPHMGSTPGFEPRPHWWEASALTTLASLAPLTYFLLFFIPCLFLSESCLSLVNHWFLQKYLHCSVNILSHFLCLV